MGKPTDMDYKKEYSLRRLEKMQFPTKDEQFKRRLKDGGARDVTSLKEKERGKDADRKEKDRERDRPRDKERVKEKSNVEKPEEKPKIKPKNDFQDLFGTHIKKEQNGKKDEIKKEKKESHREGSSSSKRSP